MDSYMVVLTENSHFWHLHVVLGHIFSTSSNVLDRVQSWRFFVTGEGIFRTTAIRKPSMNINEHQKTIIYRRLFNKMCNGSEPSKSLNIIDFGVDEHTKIPDYWFTYWVDWVTEGSTPIDRQVAYMMMNGMPDPTGPIFSQKDNVDPKETVPFKGNSDISHHFQRSMVPSHNLT